MILSIVVFVIIDIIINFLLIKISKITSKSTKFLYKNTLFKIKYTILLIPCVIEKAGELMKFHHNTFLLSEGIIYVLDFEKEIHGVLWFKILYKNRIMFFPAINGSFLFKNPNEFCENYFEIIKNNDINVEN